MLLQRTFRVQSRVPTMNNSQCFITPAFRDLAPSSILLFFGLYMYMHILLQKDKKIKNKTEKTITQYNFT